MRKHDRGREVPAHDGDLRARVRTGRRRRVRAAVAVLVALIGLELALRSQTIELTPMEACYQQRRAAGLEGASCYTLRADSFLKRAGTDGQDVGANVAILALVEQCVLEGDGRSPACVELEKFTPGPPAPPVWPDPPPPEICGDKIDNDRDGLTDEGCPGQMAAPTNLRVSTTIAGPFEAKAEHDGLNDVSYYTLRRDGVYVHHLNRTARINGTVTIPASLASGTYKLTMQACSNDAAIGCAASLPLTVTFRTAAGPPAPPGGLRILGVLLRAWDLLWTG